MDPLVSSTQNNELAAQLEFLKNGTRDAAHEISNSLAIFRMAISFLQTTEPTVGERERYFKAIEEGISKIEICLHKLHEIREGLPPRGSGSSIRP